MIKPKWDFADPEVLGWASMADQDAKQFARLALTWPQDRCDALAGFVQKMFGRRVQDRGSLQKLSRALTGVKQYRSARDQEEREKAVRLEEVETNRKALAAVAKAHPKGSLIGGAGSKLPGSKGH
jgi:hypothetical protein